MDRKGASALLVTVLMTAVAWLAGTVTAAAANPDLVISKVVVEKIGGGDFFQWKYTVTVKNIGAAAAGASKAAIYYIGDPSQNPTNPTGIIASVDVPGIAAGKWATVSATTPGAAGAPSIFRMVAADAPAPGKLLGQVAEGAVSGTTQPPGELNNFFGFPMNLQLLGSPQTYKNPAAQ